MISNLKVNLAVFMKVLFQVKVELGQGRFLFALTLIPTVSLCWISEVVEHLGGMQAATKLFTPILRPLLE